MTRVRSMGGALLAVLLLVAACSSTPNEAAGDPDQPRSSVGTAQPIDPADPVPPPTTEAVVPTTTTAAPPAYCEAGPFRIDPETLAIIDPLGEPFLPVGINLTGGVYEGENAFWENSSSVGLTQLGAANLVDNWQINTVRLNLNSELDPNIWIDPELDRLIELLTRNGIVVMLENHSSGTGFDPTDQEIAIVTAGMSGIAERWADNSCVWFNPHNEPGGKVDQSAYHLNLNKALVTEDDAWVQWHVPVIEAIRDYSDAIVVLDDTHWGQGKGTGEFELGQSAVITYGPQLNEKYENLLYSVHVYERWAEYDVAEYFDAAHAVGVAVVVGEVSGHQTEQTGITRGYWPAATRLFELREPGVGILAWHGNSRFSSATSVARRFGRRFPIWQVSSEAGLDGIGVLLWDFAHNPPPAIPER
ncbi:MAG: cellulase family glycosylhydrolase [Acidimicrobiales bacterium]|nr:cellulase family glycosylhydrolase [Acidimicrobiales bacterium]